ncbi:MAG: malate synthase [Pseudonocardiales bacterium]|nr:malate synthase [Pseudonocardiales bacterium]
MTAITSRIAIRGRTDGYERILTPEAIAFVVELDGRFAGRRCELLEARRERHQRTSDGWNPDFDPATAAIRSDPHWTVAPPAPGLVDRRVEITGPPEARMTVNALNSGAKVWLADFEDALTPTWANLIQGQLNLLRAIEGELEFDAGSKHYRVGATPATIVVRPRGWHLVDKHVLIDGRPISASILDFGLYLFHCAAKQIARGSGPYFYLPKLEGHLEARLWNDIFLTAQEMLDLPRGVIRATVLIETIYAAFEMEEILYELREHSAGLNAGRWDYLFSIIKGFSDRGEEFVLPDRAAVTMTAPMMTAYTDLLVDTCHWRGAHAIGGMSAFIPSRDPAANDTALNQVRLDKQREADGGFDGSWVAHPGLVSTCQAVFDETLGREPHQLHRPVSGVSVTAQDLLAVAKTAGGVTLGGVKANVGVALRYLESWLRGSGAVAINGLMEDVATAEIARCQIWQWIHNDTAISDANAGRTVTRELVIGLLDEEMLLAEVELGPTNRLDDARTVFEAVALAEELPPFLTTWAYSRYLL